jgi:Putative addiction module component
MSTIAQELKSQIAGLSKDDRLELAMFLLDQIHEEDDPDWRTAWLEELERRERNATYVPADEVFGKYRKASP